MSSRPSEIDRPRWILPVLAAFVYLAVCGWLVSGVMRLNGGIFTYNLDDPYIHLALAESIAHGTYGINLGEAASPSSSLLWPFLLAPFASLRHFAYIPLLWNLVFGTLAAGLIGGLAARWPRADRAELAARGFSAIVLLSVANLFGLTMIGMEHTLQVLVAVACAWGIIACLKDRPVPAWCLAAAILGPAVRYEDVGLTLALGVALWGRGERRKASLLSLALLPLATAAVFFRHLGLPALPWSVLIKAAAPGINRPRSFLLFHRNQLLDTFQTTPTAWLVLAVCLALLGAWWVETSRPRRFALGGAFAAVALHILVGRFGWLNRYEPYILIFGVLVVLEVEWERPRGFFGWYAIALLACSYFYLDGTRWLPGGANSIYMHQFQTARFLHSLPDSNVAVTDLGLVAFQHPRSQYVFDLVGLGSPEAANVPRTAAWLDEITRRHNIGVVATYPGWVEGIPASWTNIGQICRSGYSPPGMRCVHYYATGQQPLGPLRERFAAFQPTLPAYVTSNLGDPAKNEPN